MERREFSAGDFVGFLQFIQCGDELMPRNQVIDVGFGGNDCQGTIAVMTAICQDIAMVYDMECPVRLVGNGKCPVFVLN
jgi:hypothetical protein